MQIGELSKKSGFNIETIRFYEKEGLLSAPGRSPAGYRLYKENHVEQLFFIKHCRILNISLSDIKMLLDLKQRKLTDCREVNDLIEKQLELVKQKRKDLKKLETQLTSLSKLCHGSTIDECKILDSLDSHGSSKDSICKNKS